MDPRIMIKYGELTTKKANRNLFIKTLKQNIQICLKEYQVKIEQDRVRMYIIPKEAELEEVINRLKLVFGVFGIVKCHPVNTNREDIQKKALELVTGSSYQTFKVETRRADKSYPIPSMEFSKEMGAYLLENTNLKVDVHHPDVLLTIEIRREGTFLYTKEIPGIGGYPVGVQGKGLLMLSGGIDSPVAGYLSLKRGVDLECIYFEAPPHTSEEAKNKVFKLASILNEYSSHIKVHVIPFTKLQETIYKEVDPTYMITIMRRMMYRISERVARRRNCRILINGESIGQVASQTLQSMVVINEVVKLPVIRPVACFDKLEIIELSKKIGTYETSILPFEDCCTIFVPKHPVIYPQLEKSREMEQSFDFEPLIYECITNMKTVTNFEIKDENNLL